ncbi:MAG TPA: hypothetical protein VGO26_03815 [Amnibacterium sp.]|jgi:hypothetical protein|nr:hypothetical protein [Amnibacterium sp.]
MSGQQRGTGPDDEVVAEPFDQTNGVVAGLEGESGGTAGGEARSGADRRDDDGEVIDTDDVAGQGAMDAGFIVGRQQ